jgi:hypothetical protein
MEITSMGELVALLENSPARFGQSGADIVVLALEAARDGGWQLAEALQISAADVDISAADTLMSMLVHREGIEAVVVAGAGDNETLVRSRLAAIAETAAIHVAGSIKAGYPVPQIGVVQTHNSQHAPVSPDPAARQALQNRDAPLSGARGWWQPVNLGTISFDAGFGADVGSDVCETAIVQLSGFDELTRCLPHLLWEQPAEEIVVLACPDEGGRPAVMFRAPLSGFNTTQAAQLAGEATAAAGEQGWVLLAGYSHDTATIGDSLGQVSLALAGRQVPHSAVTVTQGTPQLASLDPKDLANRLTGATRQTHPPTSATPEYARVQPRFDVAIADPHRWAGDLATQQPPPPGRIGCWEDLVAAVAASYGPHGPPDGTVAAAVYLDGRMRHSDMPAAALDTVQAQMLAEQVKTWGGNPEVFLIGFTSEPGTLRETLAMAALACADQGLTQTTLETTRGQTTLVHPAPAADKSRWRDRHPADPTGLEDRARWPQLTTTWIDTQQAHPPTAEQLLQAAQRFDENTQNAVLDRLTVTSGQRISNLMLQLAAKLPPEHQVPPVALALLGASIGGATGQANACKAHLRRLVDTFGSGTALARLADTISDAPNPAQMWNQVKTGRQEITEMIHQNQQTSRSAASNRADPPSQPANQTTPPPPAPTEPAADLVPV